jgi:hypothetical protein
MNFEETAILVTNFQMSSIQHNLAARKHSSLIHVSKTRCTMCIVFVTKLIMRFETIFAIRKKHVSPDIISKWTKWNNHCHSTRAITPATFLNLKKLSSASERTGEIKKICDGNLLKNHISEDGQQERSAVASCYPKYQLFSALRGRKKGKVAVRCVREMRLESSDIMERRRPLCQRCLVKDWTKWGESVHRGIFLINADCRPYIYVSIPRFSGEDNLREPSARASTRRRGRRDYRDSIYMCAHQSIFHPLAVLL